MKSKNPPFILKPILAFWSVWKKVGARIFDYIAYLALFIVFYGVMFPLAMVMRCLGKRPINNEFRTSVKSYRIVSDPLDPEHMTRMF